MIVAKLSAPYKYHHHMSLAKSRSRKTSSKILNTIIVVNLKRLIVTILSKPKINKLLIPP